ncbi:MAG: M15 family metallopeptidase [Actinobacteria bacterium]|nr:M15 family metallopeptidase [Actinomycetota bacterium]
MTSNVDGTDVGAADDDSSQAGTDHPATDADASPDSAPGHGDTTPEPAAGADDAHAAADERKSTVTGRTGHAGRTERDDEPDDPTVRSTTKVAVSRDRESDGTAHVTVQIEVDAEAWASMTGESTANGGPSDARAATAEDEACDVPPHGSAIVHDDNVARTIVAVGQTVGASDRALLAALEAAIIESGVQNLDDGDDSLGVFQLRPSAGWGTSAQVTDPVYATRAFLLGPRCAGGADANSEPGAVTRDRTHEGTAGQLAHAVQRSASPRIYDAVEGEARAFLRRHRDADPKGTYALIPSILPPSGEIGAWGGYDNGRIPLPALASIGAGHLLRTDAAAAWIKLQRAATADLGHTIGVTDSYRSYEAQVAVKTAKGYLAATPGRSNHGWGLALDLDTGGWDGTAMRWLQANAHRFGWHHPDWARIDGSKPEHWHWEYGGTTG